MGLDCSHGAFHGAYSAFNRLRQYVARGCGGSFPPHDEDGLALLRAMAERDGGETPDNTWWGTDDNIVPPEHAAGIDLFLSHSDCEGTFSPAEATKVAGALRWWLAAERFRHGPNWPAAGHLARWGWDGTVERFAAGCERAAAAGEPLRFE